MESAIEFIEQVVNVFLSPLHRRQAAGVLARQRFNAGPEQRDEEIFAQKRVQRRLAARHNLRQVPGRPRQTCQRGVPRRIQRQQTLTDRFICGFGLWTMVKDIDLAQSALSPMDVDLDKNSPDKRRDCADRIWYGEGPGRGQADFSQARFDSAPDRPDIFLAGLCRERCRGVRRQDIVERADKSLVGTENEGAAGWACIGARFLLEKIF